MLTLAAESAAALLASPWAAEEVPPGALLVEFAAIPADWPTCIASLPCVTVAVLRCADVPGLVLAGFDVVVADKDHHPTGWVAAADGLDEAAAGLARAIDAHPHASLVATQVLRATEGASPSAGFCVESLGYSMLQAGPEFAAWLAGRDPPGGPRPSAAPVLVERNESTMLITLNRPEVRNAVDRGLRDALVDALRAAAADSAIHEIVLRGNGPSFCSGGDLSEFGEAPDPVTAHAVRLTRSPGAWAAALGPRLRADVQGACVGAGVEIGAWAHEVVATDDTRFRLPEVAMGLIPGAGGTVSIPRRIGRQRTAWLALSGEWLDATTAMAWGLVDRRAEG